LADFSNSLSSDLLWLSLSPSLLLDQPKDLGFSLVPRDFLRQDHALIQKIAQDVALNPDELQSFLKQHSRTYKVGLYAQALLEFVLRKLPRYHFLASDWVVQDPASHRTEGSVDFLLLENTSPQKAIHLEFAVKFYLLDPNAPETLASWVGPEGRDRLDQKVEKIRTQQLPLSQTPHFKSALSQILGERSTDFPEFQRFGLTRGKVFLPYSSSPLQFRSQWIDPQIERGFYLRQSDPALENLIKKHPDSFVLQSKLQWLSPETVSPPSEDSRSHISAPMVPYIRYFPRLKMSLFVVHDQWPNPQPRENSFRKQK